MEKAKIEIDPMLMDRIKITLPSGKTYEVVCNDDEVIKIYASSNFGSSLLVMPMASNCVHVKESDK